VALNGDDPARIAARLPNPRSVGEDEATNFNRPLVYAPPGMLRGRK